jgi:hypothetical protein
MNEPVNYIVVECLKIPLRIRKVPSSNFGLETGYLYQGSSCRSSLPPGKEQDVNSKWVTATPFCILSNRLLMNQPNIQSYKSFATTRIVKYTVKHIRGPTDNVFKNQSGSLLSAVCVCKSQSVGCLTDHYQTGTQL